MTTLHPLHGIIAVRIDVREETDGGIALLNEEALDSGTVIAAGPGEHKPDGTFLKVSVKPGDRIVVAPASGIKLDIDGEELLFMTQNEIVGIINEI